MNKTRQNESAKRGFWQVVGNLALLLVGAFIAAFALDCFLLPSLILDGGVTGISIIVERLSGVNLSLLIVVINIPFFIVGLKKLGWRFVCRAMFAIVAFALFLELCAGFPQLTRESVLAAVFGGVLLGVGVGWELRFGACLDGTEVAALLINKKLGMSVGRLILCFNVLIYTAAGFVFGADRAMYSLIAYFISAKVIDLVQHGLEDGKAALIITNESQDIAANIHARLGRTVTLMEGEGLISGKKAILYCVITRAEVFQLKRIIRESDSSAFCTITDISEILGHHIKQKKDLATPENVTQNVPY